MGRVGLRSRASACAPGLDLEALVFGRPKGVLAVPPAEPIPNQHCPEIASFDGDRGNSPAVADDVLDKDADLLPLAYCRAANVSPSVTSTMRALDVCPDRTGVLSCTSAGNGPRAGIQAPKRKPKRKTRWGWYIERLRTFLLKSAFGPSILAKKP
jgi:hypothetical protein